MRIAYNSVGCFAFAFAVVFLLAAFAVFNKGAFAYIDHQALMIWGGGGVVLGALSWLCFAKAQHRTQDRKEI